MISDDAPLGEARDWTREHAYEGIECPCCRQFVKVYPRKLYAGPVVVLIRAFRQAGAGAWFYLPDIEGVRATGGGDFAKLRYWGLIEPRPGARDDGSNRNGWWRITPQGSDFIHQRLRLPERLYTYNGRSLGQVPGYPTVTIRDTLGEKFDYTELMGYKMVPS